MNKKQERSRFLSYILRHKPEVANLSLDREGWCSIEELLSNTDFTLQELDDIVSDDAKMRYSFDKNKTRIRANQGHSTNVVKITFKSAVPPAVLYHGTSSDFTNTILRDGLKPMKRHHVHLSDEIDTALSVGGRRKSGAYLFEIDAKQMFADGFEFLISENNVWLCDHVPPKYLRGLD